MTDEPQHVTQTPQFTEAPYSGNVRARIRGYDWQLTIRAGDSTTFTQKVDGLMNWLDQKADKAINVEPPTTGMTTPPVPQATTQAVVNSPQRAQCVMIEIGTSYSGGKTQLKFNCNGMEHPLTFTKPVGDMVKLLAPLGFTAAHIVVGQKYPVNCFVTYHESVSGDKTYKNVDKVEAA